MTRFLSGGGGTVAFVLLAAGCLDAMLLKYSRSWAHLVPLGLLGLLALALAIRAAARRRPGGPTCRMARWLGGLDGVGLAGLAGFLALAALFHAGFERAAGDGREYFAHLHSIVIDRDLDFANEARDFGARIPEVYPIGSALLWLPFYLAAHAWLAVLSLLAGGVRLDGYGPPYQIAVAFGTLVYGFAGLVLAWRVACDYFRRSIAFAAAATVCAGSFLLWYLTLDGTYAHGNSLFAVTLFLFVWHRTRGRRTTAGWLALGASAALMTMVRWQNAIFVLPALVDGVAAVARALRRSDARAGARGALAGAAIGLVTFLPQMYVWNVTNGGWFAVPQGQAGQMWWGDPVMLDVLFSSNHGLFAWHPLLYVAALGGLLFIRRDWRLALLLLALFAGQTYLNGAVSTWWGGSAYGGRRFDGCTLFFVLGLAAVVEAALRRPAAVLVGVAAVVVSGNLLLMTEIARGALPIGEGITARQMMDAAYTRVGNPFSFPANAAFAWRHGGSAADYDRLGRQLYSNVRIDLGEPDDGEFLIFGWSARERDAEGSFRWSSGPASGLSVPLLGTRVLAPGQAATMPDYRLAFRAAPFAAGGEPQAIAVEVNGVRVAEYEMSDRFEEYEARVPGALLGRGLNRIAFRYRYALSPRQAGIGDDDRLLGARFDRLAFEQRSPD